MPSLIREFIVVEGLGFRLIRGEKVIVRCRLANGQRRRPNNDEARRGVAVKQRPASEGGEARATEYLGAGADKRSQNPHPGPALSVVAAGHAIHSVVSRAVAPVRLTRWGLPHAAVTRSRVPSPGARRAVVRWNPRCKLRLMRLPSSSSDVRLDSDPDRIDSSSALAPSSPMRLKLRSRWSGCSGRPTPPAPAPLRQ